MINIHKAKKNHRCYTCDRLIPAGDRYWRIYDMEIYENNDKQHTNCLNYEHMPEVTDDEVSKMNKLPRKGK